MKQNVKLRQSQLEIVLHKLFPNEDIVVEARKHANIISPSGNLLEIDFWIPKHKLAFEFQEDHHYVTTGYADRPLHLISGHDKIKREVMSERGETLIAIPIWWEGDEASLKATINNYRPDLFSDLSNGTLPISEIPPVNYFSETRVPILGELMQASYAQASTFDPLNWWLSEKYSGIRACWHNHCLYKRRGTQIQLPEKISNLFPPSSLDGEIWLGRNSFKDIASIITATNNFNVITYFSSMARFVVFDSVVPETEFEIRFQLALVSIVTDNPFLIPCFHTRCAGKKHLRFSTHEILAHHGEGIIARRNKSMYIHGRSDDLVKLKAHTEIEGIVEEVHQDHYTVKLPNDELLQVRGNGQEVAKIGEIVSIVHQDHSRIPSLYRRRPDLCWDDLRERIVSEKSQRLLQESDTHPKGYWVKNEHQKIREFFEELCTKNGMDPRSPESFYSIKLKDVLNCKGGYSAIYHHGGSLAKVFLDVFPDIGLDPNKFNQIERIKTSRKNIFENFAAKQNIDPSIAEMWYNVNPKDLAQEKGGYNMMDFYAWDLCKALQDLFPEVPFVESKFAHKTRSYWNNKQNKRKFFCEFAEKMGFDPEDGAGWACTTKFKILQENDSQGALQGYGGSLAKALQDIFPDVIFKR